MERLPSRNNEQESPVIPHPEAAAKTIANSIRRVREIARTDDESKIEDYAFWIRRINYSAQTIASQERSFVAKQKRLAKEQKTVPKEEFLEAEDRYAREWGIIQDYLKEGNLSWSTQLTSEAVQEVCFAVEDDTDTISKSIEAFAANFYVERSQALVAAIRQKGEPNADDLVREVTSFYKSVDNHLFYKWMTPSEKRDFDSREYERARTATHNNVIKHLNRLNALARQYGTRPFTPRDFLTSDMDGKTPAMKRQMRYDRDAVEEYYAIAFASDEEKAKKRFERNSNFY